jgi:hypothetical protein
MDPKEPPIASRSRDVFPKWLKNFALLEYAILVETVDVRIPLYRVSPL